MEIRFDFDSNRPLSATDNIGQFRPACVTIDPENGILGAVIDYGMCNGEYIYGRAFRYYIHPEISACDLKDLFNRLLPLAQRMEDGYDWHYEDCVKRGDLDEDAATAEKEVAEICAEYAEDEYIPEWE